MYGIGQLLHSTQSKGFLEDDYHCTLCQANNCTVSHICKHRYTSIFTWLIIEGKNIVLKYFSRDDFNKRQLHISNSYRMRTSTEPSNQMPIN
jgi:hypothetical protein